MKWMKSIAVILVTTILVFSMNYISTNVNADSAESTVSNAEATAFPHDQVIDVNIEIDTDVYEDMIANATDEEIVMANITYNGYTFSDIGIRTKGNSSLRDVAQAGGDRFSFKVDFNYYLENQSLYGITKLNLNNIYSDPTMMAEYIAYEMLDELDAVAPNTTYAALSINGEYFGLYLAVEQVNDTFLVDNYGNTSGELYKPDMGVGSDLKYVSDNGEDYTGMTPENMDSSDNGDLVQLINAIESGEDLESLFNVDSYLKYLAVSTITVNLDSFQGGMYHNYYLYNNDGTFEWIGWDLNMAFNGFPGTQITDDQAIEFLIDEPVVGSMENYPLVQAIFENEDYVETYHGYLAELMDGYLSSSEINAKVLTVYQLIKDYVEIDPSSFYTYEEFENALFGDDETALSLLNFVEQRNENVGQQLSGEIASTNDGEGNAGSAGLGGMGGGPNMGGNGGSPGGNGNRPSPPNNDNQTNDNIPPQQDDGEQSTSDMPPPPQNGGSTTGTDNGTGQNTQGNNMLEKLLQNVNVEDLPDDVREYIDNGQLPPKEMMDAALEALGVALPEPPNMGGDTNSEGEMPNGQAPVNETNGRRVQGSDSSDAAANSSSLMFNSVAVLISLIAMVGFGLVLWRRDY